jgi:hypothetical protein
MSGTNPAQPSAPEGEEIRPFTVDMTVELPVYDETRKSAPRPASPAIPEASKKGD